MASPGQFVEQAMMYGYQQGNAERDQKKQDTRGQEIKDLLDQRDALKSKFSQTLDSTGQPTDTSKPINEEILKNQAAIREFYHPDKNPGAIANYGHMLMERLHIAKPQATDTMVVPKPKGLVEAGNLPIWQRPTVQNADGSHSSEYSTSFQDNKGNEVLVPTVVDGKFLTPDGKKPPEGSPEEKEMFKAAWDHYLKTGQNLGKFKSPDDADAYAKVLHARGAAPKNIQQADAKKAAAAAADQASAKTLEATAPISPAQQASMQGQIDVDNLRRTVEAKKKIFHELFPNASDQETKNFEDLLAESILGVKSAQVAGKWDQVGGTSKGQHVSLLYNERTGEYKTPNGETVPDEVLADFLPDAKAKPSTAWNNEWLAAYLRGHGLPPDYPVDDKVMAYVGQQIALSKLAQTTSVTNTLKQDVNGAWVPIQESNHRIPGFGDVLHDPLGAMTKPTKVPTHDPASQGNQPPSPGSGAAPAPGATPTHPPHPAAPAVPASGAPPAPRANPNVKVGAPLFQGRTPESDAALKNVNAAKSSYLDVQKASNDPTPVGDQGVILAWLRGRVNRVTATEIAAVNNLGGADMRLEGAIVRVVSGKMTDQQRAWFLRSAKDNYDNAVQIANQYTNPPAPSQTPAGGGHLPPNWTP